MATTLTNNDLIQAAARLGCDIAAIRAVDEVESNGTGFKNGRIVLRFETNVFRRYTGATVNGSTQAAFDKAYKLNPEKALLSTSWGRYQIMGFNYDVCGFESVQSFVETMKRNEQAQLNAFISFVQKRGIADDLIRHDWAGFAKVYNGAGYAQNGYHTKLAKAYSKYKGKAFPANQTTLSRDNKQLIWLVVGVAALAVVAIYLIRSLQMNGPQMQRSKPTRRAALV